MLRKKKKKLNKNNIFTSRVTRCEYNSNERLYYNIRYYINDDGEMGGGKYNIIILISGCCPCRYLRTSYGSLVGT